MADFPRTVVGGVSVSRLLIGTNWFLGYSHQTGAKDAFIHEYQTRDRIAEVLMVFLRAGIDTVLGPTSPLLIDAVHEAEQRAGRGMILALTPHFNLLPGGPAENEPEAVFDRCKEMGATFCMPHQCITDALLDKRAGIIRDLDRYTRLIRERGMIPGLSTHAPETVIYADRQQADVETYIQIYNAVGFLMPVEVEWALNVIQHAQKPVMAIKPLAAGRLGPAVGLAFAWNTLRDCDMVSVGTTTPREAEEVINLSLAYLARRAPEIQLQVTRSKKSLVDS